jgi:prepilin-type N-terminal cleavage/methylation domain-containing protein
MKKGFSITELMVAVAVLAITIAGMGTIFKISVQSYRTANATAEVMRNLRAITDQLNADFKSIRKEMPLAASFCLHEGTDAKGQPHQVRSDMIRFFANGDFQSVQQYRYRDSKGNLKTKTVAGNAADIFYVQSASPNHDSVEPEIRPKKILARNQTIFTSDTTLTEPNSPEYAEGSLAEWRVSQPDPDWLARPTAEPQSPIFMAKGVDNFAIQFWNATKKSWWPAALQPDKPSYWPDDKPSDWGTWPDAVKFTFTLYDSKAVLKKGMTFSHIVYIGD